MRKMGTLVDTITRYGIADAHGIESYYVKDSLDSPSPEILYIRAESNRQRHAVLFVVEVTKETDERIQKLLERREFAEALEALKELSLKISFPKERVGFYLRSWNLIPNSGLDPWS